MKKSLFVYSLAIAGLFVVPTLASAQNERRGPRTPEERIAALKESLKLSDEQVEKVKPIFAKNAEKICRDTEKELEWLLSYSPYHHVQEGTAYPAVLFEVFGSDTRVDPLHARKLCAALQHATRRAVDDAPVLLRRETDVGHGARAISRSVELTADSLAFLAHHTGLRLDRPI